ncbi:LacI family DNA-binding transcriptional regulator [Streptomyces sp. NBC_00038]|uniref:LacI family DNA-binding transcriptional regulator n=1 Tax=Streptomyces sp. NBC_00038 TaxID=2903615 RepID=UPI002254FA5E|nr:LacI family DNA-binding transcriptional regulator [Streptomyces sp. NBC_00038]MCX5561684.1 LacI family transcriptional regulator [Streptomyces sp. NBC_00038]
MVQRPVTSYDVARRAQVSQSTVSRALRDDPRVARETRDRIRTIATEMGYVPLVTARRLVTRKSWSIAIVSRDLRNPSHPTLVDTLRDEFTRHEYRILLLSDRTEDTLDRDVRALRGGLVDGVVYISPRLGSSMVSELVDRRIPLVILNRDLDGAGRASPADRVTSDNEHGGRLVAGHLLELGHRRIGLVSGPLDDAGVALREKGFRDALDGAGRPLAEPLVFRGRIDPATGFEGGRALLAGPAARRPTARITDYVAYGTLDAAQRLGLDVPGDVSVIGYNDLEASGWSMFDLSTVRRPLRDMAATAAKLLLARIDGAAGGPVHRNFGVELVRRGSVAVV